MQKDITMITMKNTDAPRALEALTKTYYKGFEPTLDCFWNTITIKSPYTAHRWNLVNDEWIYVGEIPLEETQMTCAEYKAQQRALFN